MSVQFNPNLISSTIIEDPALNVLDKWCLLTYEGHIKEIMEPLKYCQRAWVIQTGTDASKATEIFMKNCLEDNRGFKTFCTWHRNN